MRLLSHKIILLFFPNTNGCVAFLTNAAPFKVKSATALKTLHENYPYYVCAGTYIHGFQKLGEEVIALR